MLKPLVTVVQLFAVSSASAFVILLFAIRPDRPTAGGRPALTSVAAIPGTAAPTVDGRALVADRCASGHGVGGDGGAAPQLSGGRVAARFPDIQDQVGLVRDGRGAMPAFAGRLTEDQIRAIVSYTRTS